MNRQARRQAAAKARRNHAQVCDGLVLKMARHGLLKAEVRPFHEVVASARGDDAAARLDLDILTMIAHGLLNDPRFGCKFCNTVFVRGVPYGTGGGPYAVVSITAPDGGRQGLLAAICGTCWDRPDLTDVLKQHVAASCPTGGRFIPDAAVHRAHVTVQ